jgi:diguanylate cyclase (GGDEF)-like protein
MKGLIVINYRAALMLDELETFGARNKGDFYLLNPDGYYLASPDDSKEWGFMYPDGGDNRYPLTDPEHWEQISRNDAFQYESSSSIISSRIIRPLEGLNVTADDYFWIALSIVQEEQINENVHSLLLRLFLLGAFLFLLSAVPAWSISQVVVRMRRIRRELYKSANFDELTNLPNRHMFNDRLEQALIQAQRYEQKGALLFIDLDRFKAVNDSYGHEAGDELLQKVGERLDACIRESDTAARFGGDEFVVLIPVEQDPEGAEILAGKLIEILSRPYRLTGIEVSVGASIGIRIFPEETDGSGESVETILKDADSAMYKAKTSGKGRFHVWKSEE